MQLYIENIGLNFWCATRKTCVIYSFPKIKYLDFYTLYNYPTLVDMNGFNDNCDEMIEEILRIAFFGRLPEQEKLVDAVELYRFVV